MFNVIIEFSVFLILLSVPIENTRQVNARSRQERGKPLPLDYLLQMDLTIPVTLTRPQEQVLRHPNSGIRCISDAPIGNQ